MKHTKEKLFDDTQPSQTIAPSHERDIDANQRHRLMKRVIIAAVTALVVLAGLIAYFRYREESNATPPVTPSETVPNVTTTPTPPPKEASSLDGTLVEPSLATRRPLAIMVENHPDARPQYGLGQASVIYEAIAEGGITRFMALFGPGESDKVGPVRSARTYYLDWALEYDAGYAHVGGNVDALDLIPQIGIRDLDQFAIGSKAFRREPRSGIAIEHTMYSDTTKLRGIMDTKFGSDQSWTKPFFKEHLAKEHRPASQAITINFSSPTYAVTWNYDPETNSYIRTMAGVLHKDPVSGEALRSDNIFVQIVNRRTTTTRIGEQGFIYTTVGEGTGYVFQDGNRIEATWKKDSRTAPTKFFDPQGNEIKRNPGKTWVEIVHPDTAVTVQ